MSKYKLGQKVTIKKDGNMRASFYAPVNGIVTKVENGLGKSDLSPSFGLKDYIDKCTAYERYEVSYVQRQFRDSIDRCIDLVADEIEPGWHGMSSNGDDKEFIKFGVKEINGRKLEE